MLPGRAPAKTSNTVEVPGISDTVRAGMPNGFEFIGSTVPLNAPIEAGVILIPGKQLQFSASGIIDGFGPDGGEATGCSFSSSGTGVNRPSAPINGLLGVFLVSLSAFIQLHPAKTRLLWRCRRCCTAGTHDPAGFLHWERKNLKQRE